MTQSATDALITHLRAERKNLLKQLQHCQNKYAEICTGQQYQQLLEELADIADSIRIEMNSQPQEGNNGKEAST
jgi:hypothetical protein